MIVSGFRRLSLVSFQSHLPKRTVTIPRPVPRAVSSHRACRPGTHLPKDRHRPIGRWFASRDSQTAPTPVVQPSAAQTSAISSDLLTEITNALTAIAIVVGGAFAYF